VGFLEFWALLLYLSLNTALAGFSGLRGTVGRFRGLVACTGRLWLAGRCPLLVGVGRLGVPYGWRFGRALSANSQESLRNQAALPLSGNSQETFRVVLPAYVPASARIPKLLAGASASANSQNGLVCPSEREFPNS